MKKISPLRGIILKYLPVIAAYFSILLVTYSYIKYYIFDINENNYFFNMVLLSIGLTILLMIIICHLLSMLTDPGVVKSTTISNSISSKLEISEELFCKKCEISRPPRSHHCKVCQNCILNMDHHCIWIANCVGLNNRKYFYLFLFYAIMGCLYAFIGLIQKSIELNNEFSEYLKFHIDSYFLGDSIDSSPQNVNNKPISPVTDLKTKYNYPIDLIFILSSSVFSIVIVITLGVLLSLQTYLIIHNSTTIEMHKYKPLFSSPFYNKNYYVNFRRIVGNNLIEWFSPKIYLKNVDNHLNFDKSNNIII